MSINIGPPSVEELRPRITVIGVGGAGGNAIANMIQAEIEGVDFIVANTDAQALNNAIAEHRIQLGPDITQGLGAGSRPEVGRAAAEETVAEIERALEGVNMVFIAAGMGGGTGTGAAPVIAEIARSRGILTVGVVTKPFLFEGTRRMRAADAGIDELQKHVDTLIVIPNQNLFLVAKADTTFKEAFQLADEVLQQGVRSITDLMVMPGLINLDFADVRSVMNEMGKAMMGTGEGEGENRALEAAERAIANPLLDGVSMHGAKGVIISIIGGEDMRLLEVDEAANHIREMVDPEANIIWGSAFNPDLQGKIRVSVVATGIEVNADIPRPAQRPLDLSTSRGPKMPTGARSSGSIRFESDDLPKDQATDPAPADPSELDLNELDLAELDLGESESFDTIEDEMPRAPMSYRRAFDQADRDEAAAQEQPAADGTMPDPADAQGFGQPGKGGFAAEAHSPTMRNEPGRSGHPAESGAREPRQDELLLDATRLAEADQPMDPEARRRRLMGSTGLPDETPAATPAKKGAAGSGSTLFERMASLSRNPAADADDEDDDGVAMRIPRFLGRQNNQ